MATITITKAEAASEFLNSFPFEINIGHRKGQYSASSYWPNGDVGRDQYCGGHAGTLEAAVAKMLEKRAEAEAAGKLLRTAAECKAAVIGLMREHDAAPASFRDAVDALPVAL
jgi:hypothetical protein